MVISDHSSQIKLQTRRIVVTHVIGVGYMTVELLLTYQHSISNPLKGVQTFAACTAVLRKQRQH